MDARPAQPLLEDEDAPAALVLEKRCVGPDEWEYRSTGPAEHPHEPKSVAATLAELRAEVAKLRAENAALWARLGGGA